MVFWGDNWRIGLDPHQLHSAWWSNFVKNRTRIFSRCTTQEMDDVTLALVGSSGPPLDKQYISTESKFQNPQERTSGSTESV